MRSPAEDDPAAGGLLLVRSPLEAEGAGASPPAAPATPLPLPSAAIYRRPAPTDRSAEEAPSCEPPPLLLRLRATRSTRSAGEYAWLGLGSLPGLCGRNWNSLAVRHGGKWSGERREQSKVDDAAPCLCLCSSPPLSLSLSLRACFAVIIFTFLFTSFLFLPLLFSAFFSRPNDST